MEIGKSMTFFSINSAIFFSLLYNVYKKKMFTNEIEDGHEAPWKPSGPNLKSVVG